MEKLRRLVHNLGRLRRGWGRRSSVGITVREHPIINPERPAGAAPEVGSGQGRAGRHQTLRSYINPERTGQMGSGRNEEDKLSAPPEE